jgi:hypothetical protein
MSKRTVLAGMTILTSLEILTLGATELFTEEFDCDENGYNTRPDDRRACHSVGRQADISECISQDVRDEAGVGLRHRAATCLNWGGSATGVLITD